MFFCKGIQECSCSAKTYKYTYYYYALNYEASSSLNKILQIGSYSDTPDTFHLKNKIARGYNQEVMSYY